MAAARGWGRGNEEFVFPFGKMKTIWRRMVARDAHSVGMLHATELCAYRWFAW